MPATNLRTIPKTSSMAALSSQLPLWPNGMRGIPNSIARSALFNVSSLRKGERKHYKQREIAALGGISITYTGEELRQDDEDVFLQILHLARTHDLGTEVEFTGYSLLTALMWTTNNGSKKRLHDCLVRLSATALGITVTDRSGAREGFSGSLVRAFRWRDEATGKSARKWMVKLEPEIAALFDPQCYSRLDWTLRMKLPPLAKFLHTFYHTHSVPFPYKIEKLHQLTDSDTKSMRHFRANVKEALEILVDKGFFISAIIDPRTDTVQVVRKHQIEA